MRLSRNWRMLDESRQDEMASQFLYLFHRNVVVELKEMRMAKVRQVLQAGISMALHYQKDECV